jgi:hypothetical protein
VLDAVDGRVAQVDVGAGHVDACAQHHRSVGVQTVSHFAKARLVVRHAAVAERAVGARGVEVAAADAHGLGALLVHIGQAGADQGLGRADHEVEVVAGVEQVAGAAHVPVEAQPVHHLDDGVDVLLLFLLGVGVVEAQVADAAVVARQAEVQADALGVADVQVAVRLGRKARADFRRVGLPRLLLRAGAGRAAPVPAGEFPRRQIGLDDVADEVGDFDVGIGHDGLEAMVRSRNSTGLPR